MYERFTDRGVKDREDEASFRQQANYIRMIGETILTEFYGERCKEFDPECPCCLKWKALDDLIDYP